MILTLIEAALRSLLLAVAVWAGLRAFRVRNVLAQKSAWGLVLASALLMPILAPQVARWQLLPASATVILPPHPIALLENSQSAPQPVPSTTPESATASTAIAPPQRTFTSVSPSFDKSEPEPTPTSTAPASVISDVYSGAPASAASIPPMRSRTAISAAAIAWLIYLGIAGALLLRLFYGLATALLLWQAAEPVSLEDMPPCAPGLPLRASRSVSSPVTIGSGILLPADYADWDAEKLRIVLAHERSHIRQGDFYLQLLAALYAALVWFSPLGWWLKRTLSDLAETISDRAGLEQAQSGTSYAQILLEFAAAPRPTPIGVAMARPGSLSRRIERLLNDSAFSQAFAGGRRRVLIAVLLVPVALYGATALVRVQAAQQAQPAPSAAPAPTAQPAQAAAPAPAAQPAENAEPAPTAQAESVTTSGPEADPSTVEIRIGGPSGPEIVGPVVAPLPPHAVPPLPAVHVLAPLHIVIPFPPMPSVTRIAPDGRVFTIAQAGQSSTSQGRGYSYHYASDGDSYAIISGNQREHMQFNGEIHTGDIDKARKLAHGDFLWFMRDGKEYFVDDQSTVAQIKAMYAPMEELGKKQEELGRQQEELGKQQKELGRQQEQASVPTPDMRKEMAELTDAMAKLQAKLGKNITQDELSDLQNRLGDLQGQLGDLQGKIGEKQGAFGAQQGQLGAQQGKLGAEQGRLGAEQGRIAREADRKVRTIIDESLQNGKAHPVD
ncbi:MAG TPA: M56 family metallopeptidase [Terracidiphilus sp.]|jgi:beta-lactamase regulating signal transducer with metallopeptidase domain|nr:M56 family metallopeptidase [Terracidiphilus sp.]